MSEPKPLSRREVLRTASLLGVSTAAFALPIATHAEESAFPLDSGLATGKPRPLKYESIPGLLTKEQVAPHYNAHYGGALKRFLKIEQDLDTLLKSDSRLGGDAHILLQKDKVNRMNSVLLHELYFDNLMPKPDAPKEDIKTALTNRFGSFDRWQEDFRATCMAANGWGVLVRDMVNGKLYNVASDLHEIGVLWLGQPLLVCDVYEHAFYVDYQNRKKDYVDTFVTFIDWNEVNRRYHALTK